MNYHGGAALPNEVTPHRGGVGAPLKLPQTASANQSTQEEEEPAKLAPPALPYRANTTGLRTDNLPPPPTHRDVSQAGPPPPPARSTAPKPPPRLPARQNTTSPPVEEPPPPSYDTVVPQPASNPYINQSAVSNLSKAGVKVPGLGIGGNNESNPWKDERSQSQTPGRNQLSELQSRFSRMNTSSGETEAASSNAQAQAPSTTSMPSWQQSQSAFHTAQNLRANPQNVSMTDAQNAAQTANQAHRSVSAFREKHADSIANAQAKAKALDQKYKVTSKINKFLDEHTDPDPAQQQQQQHQQYQQLPHTSEYVSPPPVPQHPNAMQQPAPSPPAVDLSAASISRKPPPPPAPRKPANLQAPPPVPKATKPSFG